MLTLVRILVKFGKFLPCLIYGLNLRMFTLNVHFCISKSNPKSMCVSTTQNIESKFASFHMVNYEDKT